VGRLVRVTTLCSSPHLLPNALVLPAIGTPRITHRKPSDVLANYLLADPSENHLFLRAIERVFYLFLHLDSGLEAAPTTIQHQDGKNLNSLPIGAGL
jgi:hypothetical protein